MLMLLAIAFPAPSPTAASSEECTKYSDQFDAYRADRWHEVLIYSEAQADFAVQDGRLMLKSPENEPCEVQVYSLFTFEGDFDIQVDYDVANEREELCRFNAGIVLQTLGDEKSYKSYVATTPGKGLFFRARLDHFGEENIESFKGEPAPQKGVLRLARQSGKVKFSSLVDGQWSEVYEYTEACPEKLRVRFKLQTGSDEEEGQTCPVRVHFDNFMVNSCSRITEE
jgi:hypothetical protein